MKYIKQEKTTQLLWDPFIRQVFPWTSLRFR